MRYFCKKLTIETKTTVNKCSEGKKTAAVHFATIPCEPNAAHQTQGKPYFK